VAPPAYIFVREDGTVTVIELVAAVLLFLASALIIRAVMLADVADASATARHKREPAPDDLRRAA
jgi:hypothetical protein